MSAIAAIATVTVRELARRRIVLVGVLLQLVPLLLALLALVAGPDELDVGADYAREAGASFGASLGVLGGLLALVIGSALVAAEAEGGTLGLLATRPVSRAAILAGKLLGALVVILAAQLGSGLVGGLLLSLLAGSLQALVSVMYAIALVIPGVLLVLAIALACSTRLDLRAAQFVTVVVIIIGGAGSAWASWDLNEDHYRSFLTDEAEEIVQKPWPDVVTGPSHVVAWTIPVAQAATGAGTLMDDWITEGVQGFGGDSFTAGQYGGRGPWQDDVPADVPAAPGEAPRAVPAPDVASPSEEFTRASYLGSWCEGNARCVLEHFADASTADRVPVHRSPWLRGSVLLPVLVAALGWFGAAVLLFGRRRDL